MHFRIGSLSKCTARCAARVSRSARSLSSVDDGYLENSILPTKFYQESLPRMPIPELDVTLSRYLRFLEPVVTPQELDDATKAVETFRQTEGPDLYKKLREYDDANPNTSYLNKWWREGYLQDRRPVCINSNPQTTFFSDPNPEKMTQLQRASAMITAGIRFMRTFESDRLAPDVYHVRPKPEWFDAAMLQIPPGYKSVDPRETVSLHTEVANRCGAFPLDMSQLTHMFRSTRVPRHGMDEIVTQPMASERDDQSDHILVQRGTDFFKVMVTDSTGYELPQEDIFAALKHINETELSQSTPMGMLTTMPRDEWASARAHMLSSPVNAATLADIDSALFVICLEEGVPSDNAALNRTFLHGDGRNRWDGRIDFGRFALPAHPTTHALSLHARFDKSFSLIFTGDGEVALNFEHSWGDGVAILRFCNDVHAAAISMAPTTAGQVRDGMVQPLRWEVDSHLEQTIQSASAKFDELVGSLEFSTGETESVTTSVAKGLGVSGDALMQMAIQLGHYSVHGSIVPTYESANHSAFKHGRTECIRSATPEAKAFCVATSSATEDVATKGQLLRTALRTHSKNTKLAMSGQGVDRLLFGLQKIAEETSGVVPDVFQTDAHKKCNYFILSTSTLNSPSLCYGSFGPVNDACYAIGYGLRPHQADFVIGSYRGDQGQVTDSCVRALEDMVSVLKATSS